MEEYYCKKCKERFEVFFLSSERNLICPYCYLEDLTSIRVYNKKEKG